MDDLATKLAEALRPMLDHFCSPAITRYDLKLRDQAREALRLYDEAKAQPKQAAEPAEPAILNCEIQPRPLSHQLADYHRAISEGPLHYTWQDKPHRLVYDLIAAVRFYAAPVAQAEPWIPVTERLPEPDSGEVLIWLTGGRCAFDEWHTHREDPIGMSTTHTLDMGCMWRDYEFEEVTHWVPLPQPPKENKHG